MGPERRHRKTLRHSGLWSASSPQAPPADDDPDRDWGTHPADQESGELTFADEASFWAISSFVSDARRHKGGPRRQRLRPGISQLIGQEPLRRRTKRDSRAVWVRGGSGRPRPPTSPPPCFPRLARLYAALWPGIKSPIAYRSSARNRTPVSGLFAFQVLAFYASSSTKETARSRLTPCTNGGRGVLAWSSVATRDRCAPDSQQGLTAEWDGESKAIRPLAEMEPGGVVMHGVQGSVLRLIRWPGL